MHKTLVAGAGKIGEVVATLLLTTSDFEVHMIDIKPQSNEIETLTQRFKHAEFSQLDVSSEEALTDYIKKNRIQSIVSCLPYFCHLPIARVAAKSSVNYFDLTEDTNVSQQIKALASNSKAAFFPQCGLAPGFISIVANSLMRLFDEVEIVHMRVGALPVSSNHALKYALTWSTDGVINEYGNPCYAIVDKKLEQVMPLEGLETIQIDGMNYEAFHTSGGLGTLPESYQGKVKRMNYKTIRYPGHCEKMRFLMNDLKLNHDRETLKKILEKALPQTKDDVVIIYVSVKGIIQNQLQEKTYINKLYPKKVKEQSFSAIQMATASSVCAVLDLVVHNPKRYQGVVCQEQLSLEDFLNNRFGHYYAQNN